MQDFKYNFRYRNISNYEYLLLLNYYYIIKTMLLFFQTVLGILNIYIKHIETEVVTITRINKLLTLNPHLSACI